MAHQGTCLLASSAFVLVSSLSSALSSTSLSCGSFVRLRPSRTPPPPRAAASDDDGLSAREARRRARLLGEVAGGTTDDELSGFEELFTSLREDEERAIAAAHEQEMLALLEELEADDDEEPPVGRRRRRGARTSPRSRAPGNDAVGRPSRPPAERAIPLPPTPRGAAAPSLQWGAPGADGVASASVGGQLVTLLPTKVMVFVDGTWLYYQLFGRGRRCEITRRWGERWWESHHVDYGRLPQLISDHLSAELMRTQPYAQRAVEVVRMLVFSSFRDDAAPPSYAGPSRDASRDAARDAQRDMRDALRKQMFAAMQELHFEVSAATPHLRAERTPRALQTVAALDAPSRPPCPPPTQQDAGCLPTTLRKGTPRPNRPWGSPGTDETSPPTSSPIPHLTPDPPHLTRWPRSIWANSPVGRRSALTLLLRATLPTIPPRRHRAEPPRRTLRSSHAAVRSQRAVLGLRGCGRRVRQVRRYCPRR
jgi:hypothetical protein